MILLRRLGQCLPSQESRIETVARQQETSTAGFGTSGVSKLLKLFSTWRIFLRAWKLPSLTSPCSESAGGVWKMKTCWPRSTISKDPTARRRTAPSSEVRALRSLLLFSRETKVALGPAAGDFRRKRHPRGRTTHISCTTMYWCGTSPSMPLCLPSHQSSDARWYSSREAPFLKDSSLADRPT